MSAGLADLFGDSPPRASVAARSRSRSRTRSFSPISPDRSRPNRINANPLFLSPGGGRGGGTSTYGSPSRRPERTPPSAPAPAAGQLARPRPREEDDFEDPFAGLNDPLASDGGDGGGDGDDEDGTRKRKRVMAKVDADRLTGDKGIPALCRAAKRFKVHGKGREAHDLRNLLNVYQMWAHGMFPKGDFAHTINRVEVVCRTRRMESAMKGYREAFYPAPRSPSPPPILSPTPDRALSPPEDYDPETEAMDRPEPLFSSRLPREEDDGGDPDLEEMMAMEEMEREAEQAQGQARAHETSSALVPPHQGDDGPPVLDEEDEWEGLYD
ncbi:hypothetical protein CI109_105921 [Kwoniella shandongensis]|uniref:Chromosome segregation in meiosis protein n=1 Tax=Kwoniella shandongensis TaxID=1734106 RepID=A0A5M6BVK4_9TREE|nr:uncharacterized protein CI109_006649 [Kwoniella shandongensis]KAA5525009.1 hypothetical protein CI109_006649 [Kwoniella shandongensis]